MNDRKIHNVTNNIDEETVLFIILVHSISMKLVTNSSLSNHLQMKTLLVSNKVYLVFYVSKKVLKILIAPNSDHFSPEHSSEI